MMMSTYNANVNINAFNISIDMADLFPQEGGYIS